MCRLSCVERIRHLIVTGVWLLYCKLSKSYFQYLSFR